MKTTRDQQLIASFETAILAARTEGGHDALRMNIYLTGLPLDVRFRLLSAIEASERDFRKAA